MDAHVCSNVYTVQGGKAHSHYCHRCCYLSYFFVMFGKTPFLLYS